jgi:hypothetical protein
MIAAREGLLKHVQPLDDLVGGVNVEWRAVELGERFQREFAAVQRARGLRVMKGAR